LSWWRCIWQSRGDGKLYCDPSPGIDGGISSGGSGNSRYGGTSGAGGDAYGNPGEMGSYNY